MPPEWPGDPRPEIQELLETMRQKVVVLDDDPTGTQTVHGLPVLTEWTVAALEAEFKSDLPAFYVLTNSRSLGLAEARQMNRAIACNLVTASSRSGKAFRVISRSDSTLRGHFPGEIDALSEILGEPDGILLIPFFQQGARYTIDDVHYAGEGEWLVPVAESEYARDPVFGYRSSNLRDWVEEKTAGRVQAAEVWSVSIEDLRVGGQARVDSLLRQLCRRRVCVVNAVTNRDLEVFTLALLRAEGAGKRFLYRTAASFVPERCGLPPHALLTGDDCPLPGDTGGLVMAGSFVPRTTRQLEKLLDGPGSDIAAVEVSVDELLERNAGAEISRVVFAMNRHLRDGRDVAVYTSRRPVAGGNADRTLAVGRQVSQGLVEVVRQCVRPRFLVVKGGITASDIATQALGVRRAMVRGQLLPGVPVWELGTECRFPGLHYVVFPGNVGDADALLRIVNILRNGRRQVGAPDLANRRALP